MLRQPARAKLFQKQSWFVKQRLTNNNIYL